MIWISIDPGSKHVGMTWWRDSEVDRCDEYTPTEAMWAIDERKPDVLVVEQFRLYPTHAQILTGSTMGTSQMIGALAWWACFNDKPMTLQPAAIKIPTRALARTKGIETPPGSIHAQDSFLHGVYWWFNEKRTSVPGTLFTGLNQD